jgi:hypothetical protein
MTPDHNNDEAAARQLVEQVDELLREQQGLDAASREGLLVDLERALAAGGVVNRPVDPDTVLRELAATLDQLGQEGAIAPDDKDGMMAAFEKPLRNEGVQRALEFARRCRDDGEASAREWLVTQSGPAPAAPGVGEVPANLASAIRPRRRR